MKNAQEKKLDVTELRIFRCRPYVWSHKVDRIMNEITEGTTCKDM